MEWLTGMALLPALLCGLMMGGMALAAAVGLRRSGDTTPDEPDTAETNAPESEELPA